MSRYLNSGGESSSGEKLEDMVVDSLDGSFIYHCYNFLSTAFIADPMYYIVDIVHNFKSFNIFYAILTPKYISGGASLSLLNLN